ncbi:hypothetical protein Tco_0890798 [Tanacetum coccineum]|uniref:Reverse transcriptase domain-containing protein n=1 Tax=Tanacetum coccineum TaxID=301880 RepID=A0ABQ5C1H5_9ASTR
MLPTMSSNSPEAGNDVVSEFFAEFDALKKEVLLIKQRKDDEFDELTKIFSKLETSKTFVKFKKLLTNDLCTENESSDCNPKKSNGGVSIEEKPIFSSHHNDSSNHIGCVSSDFFYGKASSSSAHPGNDEDVSHLADNMEIDGLNAKDLYSNSQHHLHLLIKVDSYDGDYMSMLNNEKQLAKSSLNDLELQQEPDIVDVKDGILEQQANADKAKTTVIQETVGDTVEEQPSLRRGLGTLKFKKKNCGIPVVVKVSTNTSTSGLSPDVAALTDAVKALLLKNTTPPPASIKAVKESYVTCGRPHPYYQCLATNGNTFPGYQDNIQAYVSAAAVNYNQGNTGHRPPSVAHQVRPPGFSPVQNNQNRGNNYNPGNSTYRAPTQPTQAAPSNELANYMKVNETNMRAMQNQITNMKTKLKNEFQATMLQQNNKLENMLSNYFQMNKPSGSGPLPSNTVVNPKGDLKAITTRSGVSYDGPPIPPPFSSYPKVVEKEPEVTKDPVQPSTKKVQPLDVQTQAPTSEPVNAPKPKPNIPYPSRLNSQKLRERDDHQMMKPFLVGTALIDVYGEELTLRVSDEAITFKVGNTSRYSYNDAESINRIDVIDVACEEYSQEVLGFSGNSESGNPTPTSEPIIAKSSPSLTPFEGGDFILEEIEAYFASDSVPPGIDDAEFDPKGDIRLIEEMLNNDPYSPFPPKDLKCEELKSVKSSVDEPPELELKDLPSHLEYAFLEGTNKLPVIIAKNLKDEEKERLIKVLKSHKQAIAWKLSDIKGIDLQFCTYKFLMEDDFKLAIQHQRRVNPKIHEVIKKEVVKILDAGLIYPISDSPWVSPVHCVPKKGGMTVVTNEDNELIPTRWILRVFSNPDELQPERRRFLIASRFPAPPLLCAYSRELPCAI